VIILEVRKTGVYSGCGVEEEDLGIDQQIRWGRGYHKELHLGPIQNSGCGTLFHRCEMKMCVMKDLSHKSNNISSASHRDGLKNNLTWDRVWGIWLAGGMLGEGGPDTM
jgi:hypothetical protein